MATAVELVELVRMRVLQRLVFQKKPAEEFVAEAGQLQSPAEELTTMRVAPAIFFGAFAGVVTAVVSTHDKFEGPLGTYGCRRADLLDGVAGSGAVAGH